MSLERIAVEMVSHVLGVWQASRILGCGFLMDGHRWGRRDVCDVRDGSRYLARFRDDLGNRNGITLIVIRNRFREERTAHNVARVTGG